MEQDADTIPHRLACLADGFLQHPVQCPHWAFAELYAQVTSEWLVLAERSRSREVIRRITVDFHDLYLRRVADQITGEAAPPVMAHWQPYFALAMRCAGAEAPVARFRMAGAGARAHICFDLVEVFRATLPGLSTAQVAQLRADLLGAASDGVFVRAFDRFSNHPQMRIDAARSRVAPALVAFLPWLWRIQSWRQAAWNAALAGEA